MKSQDGQVQLRRTGFRWIKTYALLEPLQELRGHMEAPSIDHPERLLQLWVRSIDTLRRLIQAMQSLWRRRSTFHIIAWLEAARKYGSARKPICRTFTLARGMNGIRTGGSPLLCSGCVNSARLMVGPLRSRFRCAEGGSERAADIVAEFL